MISKLFAFAVDMVVSTYQLWIESNTSTLSKPYTVG